MNNEFPEVFALSVLKKIELLEELWDSISSRDVTVPDWHILELNHRKQEYDKSPDGGLPWETVKQQILKNADAETELDRTVTVSTNIKEEARRLIDRLPDDANWDDLMEEIYVRAAIENGIRDSDAGRTVPVEEVRARFGLPT